MYAKPAINREWGMRACLCLAMLASALTLALFPPSVSSADVCQGDRIIGDDGSDKGRCADPSANETCENGVIAVTDSQGVKTTTTEQCSAPPAPSGALLRDGVFGCQGSKYANPGSLVAVGGVYVPVNDAAVTLNTGYLVYKECTLDGVVSKIKAQATAELTKTAVRSINTARGGKPLFVQNPTRELNERALRTTLTAVGDQNLQLMCPGFKSQVRTSVVRETLQQNNAPESVYACTIPQSTSGSIWDTLAAFREPQNNALGARLILDNQIDFNTAYDAFNQRQQWDWNNGFYSVTSESDNPLADQILTPGFIIAESLQQMIGSGFRQLESANEIDEIVSALWGGLTTQLLTNTASGLAGIASPQNGQPSYLDRMAAEASAAVRDSAVNAALAILRNQLQVENIFKGAKETIANILTTAINRLRTAENSCWDLIVPAVQNYARNFCSATSTPSSTTGCIGSQPNLVIATSTVESQKIITAQIAPLASTTAAGLQESAQSLAELNTLIADVTNSSSATNQRVALERLDTLVATNVLHTATEAQDALKQQQDVNNATAVLVEDTLKAWGDSPDPNVGWCNVNNESVVKRWFDAWKR